MKINLTSKTVLGILGSGQLSRMSCIAANDFGIQTYVYCSDENLSPAEQVATKTYKGKLTSLDSILEFCESCDIVTLENEFIDQQILEAIDKKYPEKLFPSSKTFKKIGDKISEKETFKNAGINIVPFSKVKSADEVKAFAKIHGFPVVVKSAKGGYDGYGNVTIKNENEIATIMSSLKGDLLVEAFIPYVKELAIMVARNQSGEMAFYPIAHTIQENHICHFVSVPADISKSLEEKIIEASRLAMTTIEAVGIFAFEFFLTSDGTLYLNESAPRPHNSGHYSIEGCITSQFENHVRSVFNLPLGKSDLLAPHTLMLNLLGTKDQVACLSPLTAFLSIPKGHLHLYGKLKSKPGRKMGHFTLLGEDKNEMMKTLTQLKSEYTL